ncbi:MAG TPA: type II toxin-antitoxin system VapC family toxin [Terriglobales bacterium]|nr:type II toxin-antitoxin system VapC family toxin [Terriglobales bacterium]
MPLRYLLDTNIASYMIRGDFPRVRERSLRVPAGEIGISVVTEAELRFGAARLPEVARIRVLVRDFLAAVTILPWTSEAAVQYARVRLTAERSGSPMGTLDLMIASHAVAVGAILVTHDRGFKRLPELKVEDWA